MTETSLIYGGNDPLEAHLLPLIRQASTIDLCVSFLMKCGTELVLDDLSDFLSNGGRLRLLTGNYLHVTEPAALRLMAGLEGHKELYVFKADDIPFHPKAWMFTFHDKTGAMIVGSSNLSRSGLEKGVEWNLRHFDHGDAALLHEARSAFQELLGRPEVSEITNEWINEYEKEKARIDELPRKVAGIPLEPAEDVPEPHPIQLEALDALKETRANGHNAGLVVLATGLGKTFLAAFDSRIASRVLFVAHREEILTQAMETFSKVRPKERLGWFMSDKKDFDAEIIFASVQTLARKAHLSRFKPEHFDYIVIDEFHHAPADTYRRVIDHFTPNFLLGLTATPRRNDGGDLFELCEENLVYECNFWSGIERNLLAPFRYYGVPDLVDYENIPWRGGRFDEKALTEAVEIQARAENSLEQLDKHGGKKCLGFCVSTQHADFMAEFAQGKGLRAIAVHSGKNSAPRDSALKELETGQLDIVFAVDMFNEGVDIPSIDTVLMLRPTESLVVWLQQFGRGLRKAKGKTDLAVIDYIGNHRTFLAKAEILLKTNLREGTLREVFYAYATRQINFPAGCNVTYDLEALDILKKLIPPDPKGGQANDIYAALKARSKRRPTASEMQENGVNPKSLGRAGWFSYVDEMGDLNPSERAAWIKHKEFLDMIEHMHMKRSYKALVLRAMIDAGAFPGRIGLPDLAEHIAQFARSDSKIRKELGTDPSDVDGILAILKKNPLRILADNYPWFRLNPNEMEIVFDGEIDDAFAGLASELVEWRILEHFQKR